MTPGERQGPPGDERRGRRLGDLAAPEQNPGSRREMRKQSRPGSRFETQRPNGDQFDPIGEIRERTLGNSSIQASARQSCAPRGGGEERPLALARLDQGDLQIRPSSRSLHGGAPVLRGEKWVATKWMRERRFD